MKQDQNKRYFKISAAISVFSLVFAMPQVAMAELSPDIGLEEEVKVAVAVVEKPTSAPKPAPKPKPKPIPKPEPVVKVEAAAVVNPSTLKDNVSVAAKDIPAGLTPVVVSEALTTKAGQGASLTVKTLPGALCNIDVFVVKSTPISAKGLESQVALEDGLCSWKWTVATKTPKGSWGVKVAASKNGASDDIWTTLNIGTIR